ncbi:sensor histidine kinase [Rhodococcus opacus]|uniref:histidine kinase n=1 Tax=Rhodococcus opacus (strain B4) TaxID=632772 RepID=C1AV72_RHOOB|nr:putative two-component histidine kinase [Rhodococcus opacus B4]
MTATLRIRGSRFAVPRSRSRLLPWAEVVSAPETTRPGWVFAYAGRVQVTTFFRRRVAESEYDYPLAVPVFAHIAVVAIAGAAVAQRDGFVPPGWVLLCGLVAAVTPVAGDMIRSGVVLPRPFLAVVVTVAAALLLLQQPDTAFDFAPLILVILTGEVAATASLGVGLATLFGSIAVLSAFAVTGRLDGAPYALAGVVLGWAFGYLMLTQLRLLHQERASKAIQAEQAATRERQRIAREVHDVIAHSLSITLLHLTAARRALEQDRDVDDAVEALSDAERLGRQAMADIRRTVGLLDAGPAGTRPEPGVADLPDLIDGFRRAGLPVDFDLRGDLSAVTGTIGLGLYRITQESLANVAKHAPGAGADVRLTIESERATLAIHNPIRGRVSAPNGARGSGLRGMRERAALLGGTLRAGLDGGRWSVHAAVPLPRDSCRPAILRHIPGLS